MEEDRKSSRPMCQACPFMQQNGCMMQGMYMNPDMMNKQQMQQPMSYPGMMGQMDESTGCSTERNEDNQCGSSGDLYRDGSNQYWGHGYGHYGHYGNYGHYGDYGHYGHGRYPYPVPYPIPYPAPYPYPPFY